MEKSGHAPCITHFLALDQINHLKIVTYIVQGIISLIFFYITSMSSSSSLPFKNANWHMNLLKLI